MNLEEMFEKVMEEDYSHHSIPNFEELKDKRHEDRTLCALLYLQEKLGSHISVEGAGHDKIYLTYKKLDKLSYEDVVYLHTCGVRYEEDGLYKNV